MRVCAVAKAATAHAKRLAQLLDGDVQHLLDERADPPALRLNPARPPIAARAEVEELRRHLAGGDNPIARPEGTSTCGAGVAPFKSSLFAISSPEPATAAVPPNYVRPFSTAYVRHFAGVRLIGARCILPTGPEVAGRN